MHLRLIKIENSIIRIPIKKNPKPIQLVSENKKFGWYLFTNPSRPSIFARDANYPDMCYDESYPIKVPFVARHFFSMDLDGNNKITSYPVMEGSHFTVDGAGKYFVAGNGPIRGRK